MLTGKSRLEEKLKQTCIKNVLLKISQNLQKNTCVRVSILIKLQTKTPLMAASAIAFIQ